MSKSTTSLVLIELITLLQWHPSLLTHYQTHWKQLNQIHNWLKTINDSRPQNRNRTEPNEVTEQLIPDSTTFTIKISSKAAEEPSS